jgi:hypothetical protein
MIAGTRYALCPPYAEFAIDQILSFFYPSRLPRFHSPSDNTRKS